MGVKHYCIGWYVRILHDWWRANGEGMHAMLADATKGGKKSAVAKAKSKEPASTY